MAEIDALSSFNLPALKNFSLPALSQTADNGASLFQSPDIYNMAASMDTYANAMPMMFANMNSFPQMGGFPSFPQNGNNGFAQANNGLPQIDGANLMKLWDASVNMMKAQMQNLYKYSNFNSNLNTNNMSFNTTPTAKLKDLNYDGTQGAKVASYVLSHAGSSSKQACAEYVNNAYQNTGLSIGRGDAYTKIEDLRNNKRFKEIAVSQSELKSLPAGCVLVYPRGVAGYSPEYGHIEITLGDGRAASDFVNRNPKYDPQMKVFVPVAA